MGWMSCPCLCPCLSCPSYKCLCSNPATLHGQLQPAAMSLSLMTAWVQGLRPLLEALSAT